MKNLLFLFLLLTFSGYAQLIQTDGVTVSSCSDIFYDSGGESGQYLLNENSVYTICPDAADVSTIVNFTNLFTGNDVLNIYDGDDTTAPLLITLSGFLANPISIGATDLNTSGCLTFEFIEDGAGLGTGWVAEVGCYVPCQTITGQIDSTPAVDENGVIQIGEGENASFNANYNFTQNDVGIIYTWDFGDGTTGIGETISHTYTVAGTYTVTLTITDTEGCTVTETILVNVAIDTDTGCPKATVVDLDGSEDFIYNCYYPSESITLTVDYVPIMSNETYRVDPIPYAPVSPFSGLATEVNISLDDRWGAYEEFPEDFKFCFFGELKENFQVGSNGVVSFKNNGPVNSRCEFQLAENSLIPTGSIHNDAIMLYHDIDPRFDRNTNEIDISYEILGIDNCRALVTSFANVPHYQSANDSGINSTFQIVMYEGTGVIDYYVQSKPDPLTENPSGGYTNSGRAVLGIQDLNGINGLTPPGRNTGQWAAEEEAWRFTPDGASEQPVTFEWYDENGNYLGSGQDYVVSGIRGPMTFTVKAIYHLCGYTLVVEDTISIGYNVDSPEPIDGHIIKCDQDQDDLEFWDLTVEGEVMTLDNPDWVIEGYFTSLDDAIAEDPSLAITDPENFESGSTTVYVLVSSIETGCLEVAPLVLSFNDDVVADPITAVFCAPTDENTLTVDLTQYNEAITGGTNQPVSFYLLEEDAQNNPDAFIENPESVDLVIGDNVFYVRTDADGCVGLTSVILTLNPSPNSYVFAESVSYCDGLQDGEEVVDLTISESVITDTQTDITNFTYYTSLADAESDDITLAISDPQAYLLDTPDSEIFVVVTNSFDCSTIIRLPITLSSGLVFDPFTLNQCDVLGDSTEVWDLNLAADNYQTVNNDYVFQYYGTYEDALNDTNPIVGYDSLDSGNTTVYVRIVDVLGCIGIAEVNLVLEEVPTVNVEPLVSCTIQGVTEVSFDLNTALLNAEVNYTYDFYPTLDDAENQTNIITSADNYIVTGNSAVFVLVTTDTGCTSIVQIDLEINPIPVVNDVDPINQCDLDQDGSELIDLSTVEVDLTSEPNTTITYYLLEQEAIDNTNSITDLNSFSANTGTTIVWVRVENDNGCFAITSFDVVITDGIPLEEITISECDNGTGEAIFNIEANLLAINPDMDSFNYEVYISQTDAENETNPIVDITTIQSASATYYIRVTDPNACFSIQIINFEVEDMPVVSSVDVILCDNDADGNYEVNLTESYSDIIQGGNVTDNTYTVYLTLDDLQNEVNAITNVDNFILTESTTLLVLVTNEFGCTAIAEINITADVSPIVNLVDPINRCDSNQDGSELIDLSIVEADLTTEPDVDITYYLTEQEAVDNTNSIANFASFTANTGTNTIWVRLENENGCFTITSFDVVITDGIPLEEITITECDNGTGEAIFNIEENLLAINPDLDTYDFQVYASQSDAESETNSIVDISAIQSVSTAYYIRVTDPSGCYSIQIINLEVIDIPELTEIVVPLCDENFDGNYEVNLQDYNNQILQNGNVSDYNFSYYLNEVDANNVSNAISSSDINPISTLPFAVYVRVEANDCYSVSLIEFTAEDDVVNVNNSLPAVLSCDTGYGQGLFDFSTIEADISTDPNATFTYYATELDAQMQQNPIVSPYEGLPGQVFIRVEAAGKCSAISQFDIDLVDPPNASFSYSALQVCEGEDISLTIDDFDSALTYEWSINEIVQPAIGSDLTLTSNTGDAIVILTVTNSSTGCSSTMEESFDFVDTPSIINVDIRNTSFTVSPIGQSPFEYSLDNINWQTSSTFEGLEPGLYTVYIRSADLHCEGIPYDVLLLNITNVITPNNDDLNDAFVIPFINKILDAEGNVIASSLDIFDRYGEEMFSDTTSEGKTEFVWDAIKNGRAVNTGDYWYILALGDGRQFKGHITVKNK